ncbi:ABC-2 type transport system permease protein [Paenibacillus sp. 1_12]|uniref:ABC transporter permease n=1 Tax=Paenibacillus sp. 1_12 TaxID=1566278 RepID=UPI0008E479BB|nr:ABC transporter permease [Paenibacillus sp. 1_12]SFL36595.1 ABC-2 type transport system permease protein [Paenibacillus sp. 1_12]
MRPMLAQCKAELLRTLRNRKFIMFALLMPAVFYFIFTNTIDPNMEVGGIDWKAYYLISMTVFGVIGGSINTLSLRFAQERMQGWVQLIKLTPLPSGAYVFSKIAAQSIINLGTIVLMFIIGAVFRDVHLSVGQWIACGLWIWIGVIPFMALGTLLGTIRSIEVVQVLAQLLFMGLSGLGGLWMPIQAMPQFMQQMALWLPSYRYGQAAWNIVAGISMDWEGIGILAAYVIIFMVLSSYMIRRQEAV